MKIMVGGRGMTIALTALAPLTWGTTYVTTTQLLPEGRPLLAATARVVPAGIVLLVAAGALSRPRLPSEPWRHTALLAAFNVAVFFPLLAIAVYRLPGGVAAAAGGLQPLFVAVLTWWVAGRRPRSRDVVVGVVAAAGVALVVVHPGAGLDPVGIAAAVGANVSFAVGVVLTKRFPEPSDRLAATGWQLLLGGVVLVPLVVLVEGAPPALTGTNVAGFAYLSVVGTALAFVLWFHGIRRLPGAAPPLLGLVAPLTGAALGWLLLAESLSALQLSGFAVTVAAIAYGAMLTDHGALLTDHGALLTDHGALLTDDGTGVAGDTRPITRSTVPTTRDRPGDTRPGTAVRQL